MACGTNTGVQSGLQGSPAAIDIHCLPSTNGVPSWTPAIDQLPFAYDSNSNTVYFYSCTSNSWEVITGNFSLCGLDPVDLNVINPALICDGVMVPVTYEIGGQCIQGVVPFSELESRLEHCRTPATPPTVVTSSNGSINVVGSVDPVTGQHTYDLADNGIKDITLTGPDANGVYTLVAEYEDGSTRNMPLDTEIADVDTWTNIVDNGDGTFTATLPNGSSVTWTSDTGVPPAPTTNTHLSNPRLFDADGDGYREVVRWDLVTDGGAVVGTVDSPVLDDSHIELRSSGTSQSVFPAGTTGIFPVQTLTYTNNNDFLIGLYTYFDGYIGIERDSVGVQTSRAYFQDNNGVDTLLHDISLRSNTYNYHNNIGSRFNVGLVRLYPGQTTTYTANAVISNNTRSNITTRVRIVIIGLRI